MRKYVIKNNKTVGSAYIQTKHTHIQIQTYDMHVCILYKYDLPVGFPPGITSPREDFIILNKYKIQKGEKLQTPDIYIYMYRHIYIYIYR